MFNILPFGAYLEAYERESDLKKVEGRGQKEEKSGFCRENLHVLHERYSGFDLVTVNAG